MRLKLSSAPLKNITDTPKKASILRRTCLWDGCNKPFIYIYLNIYSSIPITFFYRLYALWLLYCWIATSEQLCYCGTAGGTPQSSLIFQTKTCSFICFYYLIWTSQFASPELWNKLPLHIKNSRTLNQFKSSLKTYLFELAFL